MIAGTDFDCATNPHPMDFAHEVRIRQMQILAGFVTYLDFTVVFVYFDVVTVRLHFITRAVS